MLTNKDQELIKVKLEEILNKKIAKEKVSVLGAIFFGSRKRKKSRPKSDLDLIAFTESKENVPNKVIYFRGKMNFQNQKNQLLEWRIYSIEKLKNDLIQGPHFFSQIMLDGEFLQWTEKNVKKELLEIGEKRLGDEEKDLISKFQNSSYQEALIKFKVHFFEMKDKCIHEQDISPLSTLNLFTLTLDEFYQDVLFCLAVKSFKETKGEAILIEKAKKILLAEGIRPHRYFNWKSYSVAEDWFVHLIQELEPFFKSELSGELLGRCFEVMENKLKVMFPEWEEMPTEVCTFI